MHRKALLKFVVSLVPALLCVKPSTAREDSSTAVPAQPQAAWRFKGQTPLCPAIPAPNATIALVEAIDLSLCNNPRTRQSWIAAKVAAAQVGVAKAPLLPSVTATADAQRSETRNVASPGGTTELSAVVTMNYLLFDFGGRDAAVEQAKETLLAANWTHNATLQAVMLEAIQGYYQLAASGEALQSALAAEQSSMQSLDAARARLKAGNATRADVLQAQTANSQARLTRTQAEGDVASAQGALASTLGLPVEIPLQVAVPRDSSSVEMIQQGVPVLLTLAKQRRPDLAAAEAQIRAARQNVKIQESADRPIVSLSGSLGATQSMPGADPRAGAVGLSVSVPLFTGHRTAYQKLVAEQQLEARVADRDRLANDAALEVWRAFQDLRTQGQSVLSAEDLAASAQESYNVSLGRYKSGVGTVTDLLNAQAVLASANLQKIQARYRWNLAKSTLARALGIIDSAMYSQGAVPSSK